MANDETKILFTSPSSNLAGAPRMLYNTVKYLNRGKFEPVILSRYPGPMLSDFSSVAPTHVFQRKNLQTRWSWLNLLLRQLQLWWRKKRYIAFLRELQPDVIYHNGPDFSEYVRWSVALPVPKVMHIHGLHTNHMALGPGHLALLASGMDLFICAANRDASRLHCCLGVPLAKIRVFQENIDVAEVSACLNKGSRIIRSKLGFVSTDIVIGVAGTIAFIKGTDLFVEAAAILRRRFPDRDLKFVWLGASKSAVNAFYEKAVLARVHELGLGDVMRFVSEVREPYDYISMFDVFVLCSREEALPLVVLEALLIGKPVVAFDVGDVAEVLSDGVGLVIHDIRSEALATGIASVLESSDLRQQFSEAGPVRVRERFDIARNIRQLEDMIEDVLR